MGNVISFVDNGRGDIPADIVADVAGLPPARARLARHIAWIASVEGGLGKLMAGKARLESDIAKADGAMRDIEALVDADAETLASKIKAGLEWTLSQFGGQQAQSLDAKLAASKHQAAVAKRALAATVEEVARVEAHIVDLRGRKSDLIAAAVREAAKGLFNDYAETVDQLRECMTHLAALERHLGVERLGRVVAVAPDFGWAHGLAEMPITAPAREIGKAQAVWARFAAALGDDPRAPVSLLEFGPLETTADEGVTYENLHQLERRVVDARNNI